MQVIPFRRDDLALDAEIRAETDDDARARERVHRNTLAGTGWYRREARGTPTPVRLKVRWRETASLSPHLCFALSEPCSVSSQFLGFPQ